MSSFYFTAVTLPPSCYGNVVPSNPTGLLCIRSVAVHEAYLNSQQNVKVVDVVSLLRLGRRSFFGAEGTGLRFIYGHVKS